MLAGHSTAIVLDSFAQAEEMAERAQEREIQVCNYSMVASQPTIALLQASAHKEKRDYLTARMGEASGKNGLPARINSKCVLGECDRQQVHPKIVPIETGKKFECSRHNK